MCLLPKLLCLVVLLTSSGCALNQSLAPEDPFGLFAGALAIGPLVGPFVFGG